MKIKRLALLVIVLASGVTMTYADPVEEGKLIFTSRCAACHNVNRILTGPALAGVDERRSMDWIVQFVQSSQSMIRKGDKDAVALYQQFNRVPMPDHPDLTADNIKDVVAYIKSQATAADEKAPFAKPGKLMTAYRPLSIQKDAGLFGAYFLAVIILIVVLLLVVRLKSVLPSSQEYSDHT